MNVSNVTVEYPTLGNVSYEFNPTPEGPVMYITYIVYGIVFFFGIIGNIIVLYVVGYRKKKRNSGDLYVVALACTDFLSSVIECVIMLNHMITHFSGWLYGEVLCYILPGTSQATTCASGWVLVLISLNRYRIISKPLAHEPHWSMLYLKVALVWVTSIAVVLPEMVNYKLTDYGCFLPIYHTEDRIASFIKAIAWIVYSPFVPSVIMVIVYFLTSRALRANTVKHDNNRAMQLTDKQNAKIVRMFIIIVAVFLLLTMPYSICYMYGSYLVLFDESSPNYKLISPIIYILLIPASANCCVNPVIYAKMHREVNGYLRTILQKIKRVFCQNGNAMRDIASAPSTLFSVNSHNTSQSKM